jgi:hypothetical protein
MEMNYWISEKAKNGKGLEDEKPPLDRIKFIGERLP